VAALERDTRWDKLAHLMRASGFTESEISTCLSTAPVVTAIAAASARADKPESVTAANGELDGGYKPGGGAGGGMRNPGGGAAVDSSSMRGNGGGGGEGKNRPNGRNAASVVPAPQTNLPARALRSRQVAQARASVGHKRVVSSDNPPSTLSDVASRGTIPPSANGTGPGVGESIFESAPELRIFAAEDNTNSTSSPLILTEKKSPLKTREHKGVVNVGGEGVGGFQPAPQSQNRPNASQLPNPTVSTNGKSSIASQSSGDPIEDKADASTGVPGPIPAPASVAGRDKRRHAPTPSSIGPQQQGGKKGSSDRQEVEQLESELQADGLTDAARYGLQRRLAKLQAVEVRERRKAEQVQREAEEKARVTAQMKQSGSAGGATAPSVPLPVPVPAPTVGGGIYSSRGAGAGKGNDDLSDVETSVDEDARYRRGNVGGGGGRRNLSKVRPISTTVSGDADGGEWPPPTSLKIMQSPRHSEETEPTVADNGAARVGPQGVRHPSRIRVPLPIKDRLVESDNHTDAPAFRRGSGIFRNYSQENDMDSRDGNYVPVAEKVVLSSRVVAEYNPRPSYLVGREGEESRYPLPLQDVLDEVSSQSAVAVASARDSLGLDPGSNYGGNNNVGTGNNGRVKNSNVADKKLMSFIKPSPVSHTPPRRAASLRAAQLQPPASSLSTLVAGAKDC